MSQRRMVSLEVINTDAFLDMPQSSQLLYFHLNARADDDGFVANPKSVMRNCGSQADDLKLLIGKKFLIAFDDGVCVIKHWRINNFIRKDIYKETKYLDLKRTLFIRQNGAYTLTNDDRAIPVPDGHFQLDAVNETSTKRQLRIGKDRLGKKEDTSSISYLSNIPEEDLKGFNTRFDCSIKDITNKAESLSLYCQSKGRVYKNYKAFLLNALKKDFKERIKIKSQIVEKPIELSEEEKTKIEMVKQKIRENMKI